MEPKERPYCDTFCAHPSCWKVFASYLKTIGNYRDDDADTLKQSDRQSHTTTTQLIEELDNEQYERLGWYTLWNNLANSNMKKKRLFKA
jgi:hypothetical protein